MTEEPQTSVPQLENVSKLSDDGTMMVWSCPTCPFKKELPVDENGQSQGFVLCQNPECGTYGFDCFYEGVRETDKEPEQGCGECTSEEWAEYAERYPELAKIDLDK